MNPYILSTLAPYFSYLKASLTEFQRQFAELRTKNASIYHLMAHNLILHLRPQYVGKFTIKSKLNRLGIIIKTSDIPRKTLKKLKGDVHRFCVSNGIAHHIYHDGLVFVIRILSAYDGLQWETYDPLDNVICPACYFIHGSQKPCPYCQHQHSGCPYHHDGDTYELCLNCWV